MKYPFSVRKITVAIRGEQGGSPQRGWDALDEKLATLFGGDKS